MIRRLLLATVAATIATPTRAQQTAPSTDAAQAAVNGDEGARGQDVVVVGTQIRGSSTTAALPVTLIDQQQIIATGAVSGDELFRSIPQLGDVSFNSTYLPNSSNAARGDVGSVNLRNLGVGNTLVLLNGRRVVNHPTSRADDNLVPVLTYNTNAIPVFGLERLEILRDGAAAIYGSDAVAGVVNTVLRSNFEGVQIEGQVGFAENTNLQETNLNLLLGRDLGSRGNVTFYASYDHRLAQRASDEPYTASLDRRAFFEGTPFAGVVAADNRVLISPWGSFQTLGNVQVRQGTTPVTNASGQFHIQPVANGGCSAQLGAGICIDDGTNAAAADRNLRFDPARAFDTTVIPEVQRLNLFLNGRYDLTEGLEFFTELGYYKANTKSVQSSSGTLASGPLVIPATSYYNPFGPITFADGRANPNRLPGLTGVPAGGLAVTLASYNFADAGPNLVEVDNSQFRALGGLRWRLFGLNWESAAVYSEAKVTDTSDGISQTLLQRQLALTTPDAYNPFNGSGLEVLSGRDQTPSNMAALSAIRIKTTRNSKSTMFLADLKGSTPTLFSLPGGDVGLAIGGELRRETQTDDRDPRVDGTINFNDLVSGVRNDSDLVGTSPSPDTEGRRTVLGAYVELAVPVVSPEMGVPLIRNLEFQLAGRFEHYTDVGSVAKPKIAGAWDIVEGARLRGSYAQGFKAPNLEQINARVVTRSNTRTDFVRCEAQLRRAAISSFTQCAQAFATSAQRQGNPDLEPEESDTWTAGIVLQPKFLEAAIGRVTFTADYWNVKQRGIVGIFGEGNALINDYLLRVGGSSDPNVIRADPTADDIALFQGSGIQPAGRVLFVRDRYVNLLPQEAAGVDLGLDWRLPDMGFGRINLSANAAYLDKFFLQPSAPIQALIDARAAGTINPLTTIADAGNLVRNNGKPRWRVTGTATWEYEMFQVGGFTSYTSDVLETGFVDATGAPYLVDDQMTFNLYAQLSVGGQDDGRFRIRFGVRNLTNERPPLTSNGYLGSLYNPYGRYLYANVRAAF
jgi:outer membrane receptor protein involved in Fe transport